VNYLEKYFKTIDRKPVVLILKKNAPVLKKWRNEILNSGFLNGSGRSIFIGSAFLSLAVWNKILWMT
jgi:hypothetical protein